MTNEVKERHMGSRNGQNLAEEIESRLSYLGFVKAAQTEIFSEEGPFACQKLYYDKRGTVINSSFSDGSSGARPQGMASSMCGIGSEGHLVVLFAEDKRMQEIDERLNDLYLGT